MADMDFIVRSVVQGQATIGAKVSFTNEGSEPNPPFSVEIKAREADAGLLGDRQWTILDPIRPGSDNYEVEVVLLQGDVIVERGSRGLSGSVFSGPSCS